MSAFIIAAIMLAITAAVFKGLSKLAPEIAAKHPDKPEWLLWLALSLSTLAIVVPVFAAWLAIAMLVKAVM